MRVAVLWLHVRLIFAPRVRWCQVWCVSGGACLLAAPAPPIHTGLGFPPRAHLCPVFGVRFAGGFSGSISLCFRVSDPEAELRDRGLTAGSVSFVASRRTKSSATSRPASSRW